MLPWLFSVLSIIISILSMISTRNILRNTDYVSIEFDVTGLIDTKNHRNRVKKIKSGFATSFGINSHLFDIARPIQIKHGLRININIKLNITKQIDMNIEKMVNDMNESGELEEILKYAWSLTKSPNISNINVTQHESKERRLNTIDIVVKHKSEDIPVHNKPERMISISSQVQMPPIIPDVGPTDVGPAATNAVTSEIEREIYDVVYETKGYEINVEANNAMDNIDIVYDENRIGTQGNDESSSDTSVDDLALQNTLQQVTKR